MGRMQALEAELRRIGAASSGKWTAAVTDLTTGEHFGIDEDDVMPAASLAKVPVLVALYAAVHDGKVRLDDRTAYEERHACGGSGVLQHLAPGTQMTVRDAAVLMIIISDNSATNMCVDLVGLEQVNETMRSMGLARTRLFQRWGERAAGLDARKMWVSTAGDICALMTRIARHEAVSAEASEDMMRIMRRCDGRAELSHLLPWNEMNMLEHPRENWVAEKGGAFINGIRTGGSIFHSERGHFVMSVFGEGMLAGGAGREGEGNRLLWEMGKAAWDALA
jgi:beta-lactamase class A